jgi:hypothetical protein
VCANARPIDQDHGAPLQVGRRAIAAEELLAPLELALLLRGDAIDDALGNPERAHDRFVEDAHAAAADGTHGELGMTGHAQLAHDEHIERRAELARHLRGDGHATARKTEHDHVGAPGIRAQRIGEDAPGVLTIAKAAHLLRRDRATP